VPDFSVKRFEKRKLLIDIIRKRKETHKIDRNKTFGLLPVLFSCEECFLNVVVFSGFCTFARIILKLCVSPRLLYEPRIDKTNKFIDINVCSVAQHVDPENELSSCF
jgi:hypothetical protein